MCHSQNTEPKNYPFASKFLYKYLFFNKIIKKFNFFKHCHQSSFSKTTAFFIQRR